MHVNHIYRAEHQYPSALREHISHFILIKACILK